MGTRAVGLLLLLALLGGCTGADPGPVTDRPDPTGSGAAGVPGEQTRGTGPAYRPAYDVALSETVEDSVYPDVGDPGVDALHYDLDLTWDPGARTLAGRQTLVFRAAESDAAFQLDLTDRLVVSRVVLDGEPVSHRQRGKDLLVDAEVVADGRYVVEIDYSGETGPVPAPTTRGDLAEVGWTVTPDGSVWTMQEPFGAYTWYAVNDQPADKALYDFTLRVPSPLVGVANGELRSRRSRAGQTVTRWSLSEPAASYLTTVAFDRFETAVETSKSGIPVSVWMPQERSGDLARLTSSAVASLDWVEEKLGPYPFDSLGFVYVDSTSGMETQTMITLGLTPYTTSQPVLVHETVHQWWGNQVTPTDWRDLWMNEGMTMYLQALWESENGGDPLDVTIAEWQGNAPQLRLEAGPPGDYDPTMFASANVYLLPAVMWHDVRTRLGDAEFFRLVREWPAAQDNQNADRAELVAWWERESGEELADLFERHLLDEQQPAGEAGR